MSEQTNKVVAVTGATGFVGRHVVSELMSRGWSVRGLVRSTAKAGRVFADKAPDFVVGDVREPARLQELLDGACAVVHCIGIRKEVRPDVTFASMHTGATRAIVEASERARVKRFVHVSALGTRVNAASEYHRSKWEAEQIVRDADLDWTILRPSIIHGADGEFVQMVRDWVLGRAAPRHFIPYFVRVERDPDNPLAPPKLVSAHVQPVSVDDVARAAAESLERDIAVHEVYPLVGPDTLDWPELLYAIRDALPMTHKDKKARPIPGVIAVAAAKAAGLVGLGNALPFGPSEPQMAMEDSVAPTTKLTEHLGFAPASFHSALAGYAPQI